MTCAHCKYRTNRKDNLARHVKTEHSNFKMVSQLLDDVLSNAVKPTCEDVDVEEVEEDVDPRVRARNERVARIQAEFQELFPSFEQKVRELGFSKKQKGIKRKKNPESLVAVNRVKRSSRRALSEIGVSNLEEQQRPSTDVELEVSSTRVSEELNIGAAGEDSRHSVRVAGADEEDSVQSEARVAGAGGGSEDIVVGADEEEGVAAGLGRYGCLPCGMKFRDTLNLRRHVRLVHEARKTPLKCPRPWCKSQFLILTEMWQHKANCMKVPLPSLPEKVRQGRQVCLP